MFRFHWVAFTACVNLNELNAVTYPQILKFGMDINYPPYAFKDTTTGQLTGIGSEMAAGVNQHCIAYQIQLVQVLWKDCWDAGKIGAKLANGQLDACMTYTHTQGVRNDYCEFSGGILNVNKAAGLISALDATGKPKVSGAKINPCLWKFMQTKPYYDICVKYDKVDECYPNQFFPASATATTHVYNRNTSQQPGPCSTGYCACPAAPASPKFAIEQKSDATALIQRLADTPITSGLFGFLLASAAVGMIVRVARSFPGSTRFTFIGRTMTNQDDSYDDPPVSDIESSQPFE